MNIGLSYNCSLILLRGLPGSGKSTLAKVLSENGKYPVYSIDSYFTNFSTGEYKFNHRENHIAYNSCERHVQSKMESGCSKIIVDNTFTMEWEIEPYFKLAAHYKYRVFVVTVENRHGGKSIHNIPRAQMEKMAEKYKVKLM